MPDSLPVGGGKGAQSGGGTRVGNPHGGRWLL